MNASKRSGVYPARKKDGTLRYRSSITFRGRHISLGSYTTEALAHRAYLEADTLLHTPSLRLEARPGDAALSFEKWVVLHNFRDNGLYLATPIYIRGRYLEYYLSEEDILKFDMDDLFYYARHKIMRRGGHLFVADYGMQVNILNRYGIKNYGVEGRDYRFVNGDPADLRYENIEVLNPYHGVLPLRQGTRTRYRARIHLRGNYIIGTYDTAEEAAIAYNKAIDILQKNGVQKRFTPNYLENMPASRYAELYVGLAVSERILRYRPD